jgi:hypothetical protein
MPAIPPLSTTADNKQVAILGLIEEHLLRRPLNQPRRHAAISE